MNVPNGSIVVQAWDWVGEYNTIFPYWQVRFSETTEERLFRQREHGGKRKKDAEAEMDRLTGIELLRRHYYCHAIPYTSCPTKVHWFGEEDILPTDLVAPIPPWEQVEVFTPIDETVELLRQQQGIEVKIPSGRPDWPPVRANALQVSLADPAELPYFTCPYVLDTQIPEEADGLVDFARRHHFWHIPADWELEHFTGPLMRLDPRFYEVTRDNFNEAMAPWGIASK